MCRSRGPVLRSPLSLQFRRHSPARRTTMDLLCSLRRVPALAVLFLAFASAATAQQFQITRAEYGYGDRWVDVTRRLRELARADRTFRAGNDALEVDPAPGRVKTLRIYARGPGGNTRTFDYREGDVVDGSRFSDWNGGSSNPGLNRPVDNFG